MSSPVPLKVCTSRAGDLCKAGLLVLLLVVPAPLAGCATSKFVELRSQPRNPLAGPLQLVARGGPRPTPRTVQLLRRYDLEQDLDGPPKVLLAKLQNDSGQAPTAEKVYAMAEVAYVSAKKQEAKNAEAALDLYGVAVLNAYRYLFDPTLRITRNPFDPQYRGASDIYNAALEESLRLVNKQGKLLPGRTHTIRTESRDCEVTVVVRGSGWHNDDFDRFEFVSDYKISGLTNYHRSYGLGVPLIAIRKQHASDDPREAFYPPNLSFPVTAFLRLAPQTPPPGATSGKLRAVLELYDPLVSTDITAAGRTVPLESDLTTPLAHFLSQPELDSTRLSTFGLLYPEAAQDLTGVYMLEPYQPQKIPVIMVHGLWSTPVTWIEMFNDLRADRKIRENYQFWFYLYPTGQPFWDSARQMRDDLALLRATLDPSHREPALGQMVLVGHSMGGLVSRLLTIDSGDQFWKIVSDRPFHEIKAEPDTRFRLAKTFFHKPDPGIRRVVSIGTPHGGSHHANDVTRWLGRKLIKLPKQLTLGKAQLAKDNPDYFREMALLNIDTSLDSLSPASPVLPVLRKIPPAPGITHHNIIGKISGDTFLGKISNPGDGVVSVKRAKFEFAATELVVDADHSTIHQHPRVILNVQQILHDHLNSLASYARDRGPVRTHPVGMGKPIPAIVR